MAEAILFALNTFTRRYTRSVTALTEPTACVTTLIETLT